MELLGNGFVFTNTGRRTFTLYKAGSAMKHSSSDDVTLKTELIRALNLPNNRKQAQENNVYRVRINNGLGYLVYKLNVNGTPDTASIFHYHWNYHLDLPLSAT